MTFKRADLLAAAALAAISAHGLDSRVVQAFSSAADRRPRSPETYDTEQAREIAVWNAAVDQAKAEKSLRKAQRRAAEARKPA